MYKMVQIEATIAKKDDQLLLSRCTIKFTIQKVKIILLYRRKVDITLNVCDILINLNFLMLYILT